MKGIRSTKNVKTCRLSEIARGNGGRRAYGRIVGRHTHRKGVISVNKILSLVAIVGVLSMAGSAMAGSCEGCTCPNGKTVFKLKAPAKAKALVSMKGKALVKNLCMV